MWSVTASEPTFHFRLSDKLKDPKPAVEGCREGMGAEAQDLKRAVHV